MKAAVEILSDCNGHQCTLYVLLELTQPRATSAWMVLSYERREMSRISAELAETFLTDLSLGGSSLPHILTPVGLYLHKRAG